MALNTQQKSKAFELKLCQLIKEFEYSYKLNIRTIKYKAPVFKNDNDLDEYISRKISIGVLEM
jgi:hypothetical protein